MKKALYLLLASCFAYSATSFSVLSFAGELLVSSPAIDTKDISIDAQGRVVKRVVSGANVNRANTNKINEEGGRLVQVRDKNGEIISSKRIRKFKRSKRYIVELNDAPVLSYQSKMLRKTASTQLKNSRTQLQKINDLTSQRQQIQTYRQNIKQQQQATVSQLSNMKNSIKVLARHQNVSNALIVESNDQDIESIKQLSHVKKVTEEKIYQKSLAESVPLINAPNVWTILDNDGFTLQGEGVNGAITVAIIDTGIDYTHPALGGCFGNNCRVVGGYDFVNLDDDPMDDDGHGTHVAGIVGANSNILMGVAPNVNFYAYKVLDDLGFGTNIDIIAAIEHAVDPDGDPNTDDAVDIINMSLGGEGSANDPLSIAVDNAVDAGVIVVVAAGNDGSYGDINNESPASAIKAITVASSTKTEELSDFSSKAILENNYPVKPEITAPGSGILSTAIGGGTLRLDGTSMAAPHIAGAVALLKQQYPELTAQQAKEFLTAGAIDLGLDPLAQGAGRVDIEKSMQATSVLTQAYLNFGSINGNADGQQTSQSLTIKNLSSTTKTYTLSLPSDFPEQALFSFDGLEDFTDGTVTIAPNSSATVNVNLVINDITNFPFSESASGIFYGNLEITTTDQTLHAAIIVENSHTLTLSTNATNGVEVFIYSNDFSFSGWHTVAPGSEKQVKVPNKTLYFKSTYHYLTSSDVNDNLPNQLPNNASITGYETYTINVEADDDMFFDVTQLTRIIGIQSITGFSGETINLSSMSSESTEVEVIPEYGYFSVPIMNGGNEYAIFGQLTPETIIKYQSHNKLTTFDNNEQHFYSLWHESNANELASVNFSLNLMNDPLFEVNFNEQLFTNIDRKLGVYSAYSGVIFDSVPDKVIVHSTSELSSDFAFTEIIEFTEFNQGDNYSVFDLLATTDLVTFNPAGGINKVTIFGDTLLTTEERSLTLSANSTYWTPTVSVNEEDIQMSDNKWLTSGVNTITDIVNNRYGHGLNSTYQWLCDGEVAINSLLPFTINSFNAIARPELVCNKPQILFSYDSYLQGVKYRSTALYDTAEIGSYDQLTSINLFEAEQLVSDQIINKINNKIVIKTSGTYQSIQAQIRLANSEWLVVSVNNENTNQYSIALPMMAGSSVTDLKLTFTTVNQQQVEHTLNGFFILGADAGTGNDVDDDGISNELDNDNDNDGVENNVDLFPYDSAESSDFDVDGLGDNSDNDDDNDGVADVSDDFPFDNSESLDTDNDGTGNNADSDDDGDGVDDLADAFPLNALESIDTDNDGTGNNADSDDDGDGVNDNIDAFPLDSSRSSELVVNTPSSSASGGSGGGGGSFTYLILLLCFSRVFKQNKMNY